jgi:uncharacterized phiE125 gp8 family phage protein
MSYCDVFELKAYLNLQEDSDDALLTTLIGSAAALIERQTGRTFEAASGARTYSATADCRGRMLYLDADLHSVTSIVNGDGATLAATDYVTEPRSERPIYAIKLLQSSGIAWTYTTDPEDAITVTGAWGYSASAPDDIRHACLRLAAFLYRQRDNAQTSGDAGVGYATPTGVVRAVAMPKDVDAILAPYVRRT